MIFPYNLGFLYIKNVLDYSKKIFFSQKFLMLAIEVKNLVKDYKVFSRREGILGSFKDLIKRDYRDLRAVDHISFNIEQGELLGYIGPNGAGKSTSIKMLTGILKATSGEMNVLGYHPFKDRKKLHKKHWSCVRSENTTLVGYRGN